MRRTHIKAVQTIDAGTFLVNNTSGSGTGTGSVTVNSGTLGGGGTISGAVTVNAGGTISPGNSVGSLTLQNNLTFSGASGNLATYFVELSGATSDKLAITGALDLRLYDQITFSGTPEK